MALTTDQCDRIRETFAAFLDRRAENLERLTLDHMKFNVVLLRTTATMLNFETPADLLRYRLAQYLERGSGTAWGHALQAAAREISGSGSGVEGADIEVTDENGRRHFVQVKSGPDTANKDIAQNISTLLNAARSRDPSAICVLGVCYGRPEQISRFSEGEFQSRGVVLKIGREFWEFISGDPECLNEILELAAEAAAGRVAGEQSFADRVENKVQELTAEFEARYGPTLDDETWAKFLADNS